MVKATSVDAYHHTTHKRLTQEEKLFNILQQHPEGMTDSQIHDAMGFAKSQVSARRNGLRDKLDKAGSKHALRNLGKVLDPKTKVMVTLWGIVSRDQTQAKLF